MTQSQQLAWKSKIKCFICSTVQIKMNMTLILPSIHQQQRHLEYIMISKATNGDYLFLSISSRVTPATNQQHYLSKAKTKQTRRDFSCWGEIITWKDSVKWNTLLVAWFCSTYTNAENEIIGMNDFFILLGPDNSQIYSTQDSNSTIMFS